MVPGTSRIHAVLGGINAQAILNGSFSGLHFIPLDATAVNITNATVTFDVEMVPAGDKIHWKLVDSSTFHFDSVGIKMKDSFLQKLVDLSRKLIDKVINDQMPKLSKFIDTKIQTLNQKIATQNATSFVTPLFGTNVNLTMAQAPIVEKDLVKLYFDGMIVGDQVTVKTDDIIALPPRQKNSLSEQIFIHEDMASSLFQQIGAGEFPFEMNSAALSSEIIESFPEIAYNYGQSSSAFLRFSMDTRQAKPIRFDTKEGVIIGDSDIHKSTIELVVSNNVTQNVTAAVFKLGFEAHANITLKEFIIYPVFEKIFTEGVEIINNNINISSSHNLSVMFTQFFGHYSTEFNTKWAAGWPLANLNPQLGMIGGILKDSTVTPYQVNNYLYAGFSMNADKPLAAENMEIIQ